MKNYYVRTKQIANYIIETKSTIRQTAKVFSMAKSTVHYDLQYRLKYIDSDLFEQVKKILKINFEEKHIRGGEATKNKYKSRKIIK